MMIFFRKCFRAGSSDLRSQTPSPHFGPMTMNVPKNDRDIYRSNSTHADGVNQSITNRNMMNMELTSARVPSPHQVSEWFFFTSNIILHAVVAYRWSLHLDALLLKTLIKQTQLLMNFPKHYLIGTKLSDVSESMFL